METTLCELFAGVGGFRCGLNHIHSREEIAKKDNNWKTVWFSQWEPADKKIQWAHDCYVYNFGTCMDLDGNDTTNIDIEEVDKSKIPDFSLLVGGFPCQDYSVASTLSTSKGLEGKKGVLWWSIRETLEVKKPPFVLLENVDRLIKSPASQRGRDFGIILACFRDEGYTVEWRVINAADYGYQQRRRRTFIFAYKNNTAYAKTMIQDINYMDMYGDEMRRQSMAKQIFEKGFFAETFPINTDDAKKIKMSNLPAGIGELSKNFIFNFENSGVMLDGTVYTVKTTPKYSGEYITLDNIMEQDDVDESFFIPEDRLFYTTPSINSNDARTNPLTAEKRKTWQYLKGGKKIPRVSKSGHEYLFSEGPIPLLDAADKPARTILTSEGSFSRTTHIVEDKKTKRKRLLTPTETERIQGFPTDHTRFALVNNKIVEMPINKRRFMMGNALVVNLIEQMEPELKRIIEKEE